MGYQHIDNLYKNQSILMFRECYALEKIHGCLKRGTRVLLANGTEVPIELVGAGMNVVVRDEEEGQFTTAAIKHALIQESDTRLGWIEVVLGNGRVVVCTEDHPFLTRRGWVPAGQLEISDSLIECC